METAEVIRRLKALTRAEILGKKKEDYDELRNWLYEINAHFEPILRNQMIWIDFRMGELEQLAK